MITIQNTPLDCGRWGVKEITHKEIMKIPQETVRKIWGHGYWQGKQKKTLWEKLCEYEPELVILDKKAQQECFVNGNPGVHAVFNIKYRREIARLVGYSSKKTRLQSSKIYDFVYDIIFETLRAKDQNNFNEAMYGLNTLINLKQKVE